MDLASKRCFLTGCASGIGKHMAGVLYARGAHLVLTDLNLECQFEQVTLVKEVAKSFQLHLGSPRRMSKFSNLYTPKSV